MSFVFHADSDNLLNASLRPIAASTGVVAALLNMQRTLKMPPVSVFHSNNLPSTPSPHTLLPPFFHNLISSPFIFNFNQLRFDPPRTAERTEHATKAYGPKMDMDRVQKDGTEGFVRGPCEIPCYSFESYRCVRSQAKLAVDQSP